MTEAPKKDSIEVLKWDGDFLATPEYSHPCQVEIYENVTGILLGLAAFMEPRHLQNDYVRVPLRETAHWGMTFEKEDKFPAVGICKYIEFKVENHYFNGGKSKKRVLWVDHSEWRKLLDDREAVA